MSYAFSQYTAEEDHFWHKFKCKQRAGFSETLGNVET